MTEVCYHKNMKHVVNLLFWVIASASLGFGIAGQLGQIKPEWLVLTAYIVAGFFYLFAVIMSSVLVNHVKRKQNQSVTLQKKDFILQAGTTYTVGKRAQLRPGEYKVLATDENDQTFNIRVNDYVKSYRHNTTLVLVEGDTISARSGNVILR